MALYLVPAAIALLLKAWLLVSPHRREWAGFKWRGFVLVLAALNLSEVLVYLSALNGFFPEHLLKSYYVCCVLSMVYGYHYVTDTEKYPLQRQLGAAISVAAAILVGYLLFTNTVVGGYVHHSLPVVAVKGQSFWTFGLFAILSVLILMITLLFNSAKSTDPQEQVAYAYTIRAMSLMAVATIVVMGLKMIGIEANGTAIIPLATTAFLFITARGRNSYLIEKDPRTTNPFGPEAAAAKQLEWTHAQFGINDMGLKQSMTIIEIALIRQKLQQYDGNKSKTARALGISRSGLNKKLGKGSG